VFVLPSPLLWLCFCNSVIVCFFIACHVLPYCVIKNTNTVINNNHNNNRLMALCPGLPRWAGIRRNILSLIWGHPRGDTCHQHTINKQNTVFKQHLIHVLKKDWTWKNTDSMENKLAGLITVDDIYQSAVRIQFIIFLCC